MRDHPSTITALNAPLCLRCNTRLNICRKQTPDIDAAGFEIYRLDCQQCGIALVGIIDPADDALILSERPSLVDS
jgi:hypothetical protein